MTPRKFLCSFFALATLMTFSPVAPADVMDHYSKKGTWIDTLMAYQEASAKVGDNLPGIPPLPIFSTRDFSFAAWVQTTKGGTIIAMAVPDGEWLPRRIAGRDGMLLISLATDR